MVLGDVCFWGQTDNLGPKPQKPNINQGFRRSGDFPKNAGKCRWQFVPFWPEEDEG